MKVDGKSAKGWVWFSPFQAGDEVEVISTQQEGYFEIVAILRPTDRTIALYPHCSREKNAHEKHYKMVSAFHIFHVVFIISRIYFYRKHFRQLRFN